MAKKELGNTGCIQERIASRYETKGNVYAVGHEVWKDARTRME